MSKLFNPNIQVGAVNVADDIEQGNFLEEQMIFIDKKREAFTKAKLTVEEMRFANHLINRRGKSIADAIAEAKRKDVKP
jgi:hypothetical protein